MLDSTTNQYSGDERLLINGQASSYSLLNFWQESMSDLILNVNRGTFAEWIVRCALRESGFNPPDQSNGSMRPYDITGPIIPSTGKPARIEIKSAASVQSNTPDDVAVSLASNRIVFNIRPARDWSIGSDPHRNNDLFVFCHYTATRKSDNILDLRFWDFYVYPTYRIEDDNIDTLLSKQNTISLRRLEMLGVSKQSFLTLYSEIVKTIADISDYYGSKNRAIKSSFLLAYAVCQIYSMDNIT